MDRRYGLASVAAAGLLLQALFQATPVLAEPSGQEGVQKRAQERGQEIGDAQTSLVVFEYPVDPQSIAGSGYPMMFLAEASAARRAESTSWRISRKAGMQVLEVPAGRYFVRQMATDFGILSGAPSPVPEDSNALLNIPQGAVAYLGKVRWTPDVGLQMDFFKDGLQDLQEMPELRSKPLMLVAFGSEPLSVSWD